MSRSVSQTLRQHLFSRLCDGRFHSGSELARSANVTRSAVWKAMQQLRSMGAQVQAVTHRGYKLESPTAALDAAQITELLGPECQGIGVEVAWSLESTNLALLGRPVPTPGEIQVLLAEYQRAGRGRRGRRWLAPLGGGLCMSIATGFTELPPDVSALSLAMGVCVLRGLERLQLTHARLKWPNDIVADAGKIGGILLELRAESGGPAHVVVGIGLNVKLGPLTVAEVQDNGTTPADLASLGAEPQARNALAAAVIAECAGGLREFARAGFAPFIAQWSAADALRDRAVVVSGGSSGNSQLAGVARGVDARGALLLATADGLQPIVAGEVSLRANVS